MKIGFVTSSVSRLAGGLFYSVRSLAQEIASQVEFHVDVHGLTDAFSAEDSKRWCSLKPYLHSRLGPSLVGYSPAMRRELVAGNYSLLHTQGIWQWPSSAVHDWHGRTGKPYLISPRGMLDPWAVSRSRVRKLVAGAWYEWKHLRDAACLHALCASEAESMRAYGLTNPICVVPNGVAIPEEQPGDVSRRCEGSPAILLFLSRLHPKKGLVNAINAWSEASKSGELSTTGRTWQFVIAGWDQGGHENELKQLCKLLGMRFSTVPAADFVSNHRQPESTSASVVFIGPAFGEVKDALLRMADAFILPSFSEGLPMAVLEAWAYRLPVLMTDQCNLPEGFQTDSAIQIGNDAGSICEGLHSLFSASDSSLRHIGENGRALVEQRFTWSRIAAEMRAVYEWVLGNRGTPESVR